MDDFRALNAATVSDAHPMPLIEDILNRQGECLVWSVLDMKDGYHQVPLRKEDRHLTCMSTPRGTYQWKVLVMGLKNGGAIFQRMMEWVLQPFENADPYIDDVIIGTKGKTMEEAIRQHAIDVRKVLTRLAEQKLYVDKNKAKLFMAEVEFCGHILSAGSRRPAPGKLLAIQKMDLPQTVTELRGFLGLTNYYSCYVDHYATYAGPLMSKLQLNRQDGKKGSKVRLTWKKSEIDAFEELKRVLAKKLELFIIDPDKPFIMRADASDRAIGAVLEQERVLEPGKPPVRVPVGFFSRKLGKTQLNWTPREKETYAIVAALRKWAGWIGIQPVVVTTDHKSLEDWVEEKMDTPSGPAGRRARWHETLSKFDLTVQYVPGKDNVVADAMSRFAYPACKAFQDVSFHGSAEAREEVKRIIAEELAEGRMVGMATKQKPFRDFNCCYVAGPLRRGIVEQLGPPTLCDIELEVATINSWYSGDPVGQVVEVHQPEGESSEDEEDGTDLENLDSLEDPDHVVWEKVPIHNIHWDPLSDQVGPYEQPHADDAGQVQSWMIEDSSGEEAEEARPKRDRRPPQRFGYQPTPPAKKPGKARNGKGGRSTPEEPKPAEESKLAELFIDEFGNEHPCQAAEDAHPQLSDEPVQEALGHREQMPEHPVPLAPPIIEESAVPRNRARVEEVPGQESWDSDYAQSPCWGERWMLAHGPADQWPQGVQLRNGRMLWGGLVAVPENKVGQVIRAQHEAIGHPGIRKTLREVSRRYAFPPSVRVYEAVREARRGCLTCQACEPPNWSGDAPLDGTPIPPHVMSHVSIDVFSLPAVQWRRQTWDALVVCVDRLSGWIIARPTQKLGLTAEKCAHLLLDGGWEVFGVPSVITTDQGAQFVGSWWKTMCSRLGIRQAYSQAYRPNANGRAEVAGKTLINALRKVGAETPVNWVEALPRILWRYHNLPGESGMSPFHILFGRERSEAGCPYEPLHECEDARKFFLRMENLDQEVARILNQAHQEAQNRINASRVKRPPYQAGDWVWVARPVKAPTTTKLDTRWFGPAKVVKRTGDQSYDVLIKPGVVQEVHADQLKGYVADQLGSRKATLFHYLPTHHSPELANDEWNVETILAHRKDREGGFQFLTRWEGCGPEGDTWEPVHSFIQRYCHELVKYCQKRRLQVDLATSLQPQPMV